MNKADKALACYKEGFSCSQAVFSAYAVDMGVDHEKALKIAQVRRVGPLQARSWSSGLSMVERESMMMKLR
jgi:hypothetical protein